MQRVFPKIYINGVVQIDPEPIDEKRGIIEDWEFMEEVLSDQDEWTIDWDIPVEEEIPKLFWYEKAINWIIKILNTRIW